MILERALIIRKPWIDLILSGEKIWEMRSKKTNIRGSVGLIEQGSGLVVGSTEIFNSFTLQTNRCEEFYDSHRIDDLNLLKKWNVAWSIRCTRKFDTPIPYTHPRGAVVWVNIKHLEIKV